jgi:hypothetical protein
MATGVDRFCLICFVNRNKGFELSECILDTHATGGESLRCNDLSKSVGVLKRNIRQAYYTDCREGCQAVALVKLLLSLRYNRVGTRLCCYKSFLKQ